MPISLISTTSVAPSRVEAAISSLRLQQVVGVSRNMVVAAVLVAALLHHRQLAILRILGHLVIERRMFDRDADHRMRRYVGHLLAAKKNRAPIAQRAFVLFSRL